MQSLRRKESRQNMLLGQLPREGKMCLSEGPDGGQVSRVAGIGLCGGGRGWWRVEGVGE